MAQLAARRSHNPKVASSILAGSIVYFFFFFEKIKIKRNITLRAAVWPPWKTSTLGPKWNLERGHPLKLERYRED